MKNKIKLLLLILILGTSVSSCKVGRFFIYNFADINDYKKFPSREIGNGSERFKFYMDLDAVPPKQVADEGQELGFDEYLEENKTVAFLIIHKDTIKYERYFEGYGESSIVPSFSMAKSILSILLGCAIDEGLIKSTDEPVTNYIPELAENGFDKVTILHLLQMTSGLKFNEGYFNPFGEVATFYYGTNLRRAISKLKLETEPGKHFDYVSGNPQILGLVLERALKGKTISGYFEEKLWKPLGMEYGASWSIDRKKDGLEKTFCCVNARARDFAKIGRLYLNKGNWNGKQIVSENWVTESTKVDTKDGSAWYYQYQWWLPTKNGDFMAEGILGQFIYVNPSKNLIIVRLGKKYGDVDWAGLFVKLASKY